MLCSRRPKSNSRIRLSEITPNKIYCARNGSRLRYILRKTGEEIEYLDDLLVAGKTTAELFRRWVYGEAIAGGAKSFMLGAGKWHLDRL